MNGGYGQQDTNTTNRSWAFHLVGEFSDNWQVLPVLQGHLIILTAVEQTWVTLVCHTGFLLLHIALAC